MGAPRGNESLESLERRRDELAARVAQLHWDLGGLTYEMAIRDHFRMDVLVGRAAKLQELDAELAELERILQGVGGAQNAQPAGSVSPEPPVANAKRTLPGPGVAAVLVLAMLGFGVLAGSAAKGSWGQAPRRGPLTLAMAAVPTDASGTSSSAATAPPISPEATPDATSTESGSSSETASASEDAASSSPEGGSASEGGSSKAGGEGHSTTTAASKSPSPTKPKSTLPPIKHVFLIVLADEPYASTFGPSSPAPYLSGTLEKKGELLARYYGVAHEELANEIALVSGLGPTVDNATNCPTFTDVTPATEAPDGQYTGNGCVYPPSVETVGDQLAAKHLAGRAYAQDMEDAPAGEAKTCRHPVFGTADPTETPRTGDAFATYRDPFSYFDSTVDGPGCVKEDVGLGALSADLKQAKRTPALSYIIPDLCDDGREAPCTPGAPSGLPAADTFLREIVPEILASPAYKQGGLLVITTDEAPASGPATDSSSCCSEPRFPGIPGNQSTFTGPEASKLPPPGGGQVGALLLSSYVKPHTVSQESFNHFSLLRTIEDLFELKHLGYAGAKGVSSFGPTVFSGSQ